MRFDYLSEKEQRELKAPFGWDREVRVRDYVVTLLISLEQFVKAIDSQSDAERLSFLQEQLIEKLRIMLSSHGGSDAETSRGTISEAFTQLCAKGILMDLPQTMTEPAEPIVIQDDQILFHIEGWEVIVRRSSDHISDVLSSTRRELAYCNELLAAEDAMRAELKRMTPRGV